MISNWAIILIKKLLMNEDLNKAYKEWEKSLFTQISAFDHCII